jgi:CubicO group peptidase (beta-lactamase class C family)
MRLTRVLRNLGIVLLSAIVLWLAIVMIVYSPEYVYRTIVWQDSDAFDWQKFPNHQLTASATPYHFAEAPDPRVEETFQEIADTDNWNKYLEENSTQSFIVIKDGTVVYENYFNGAQRDSMVTSFSVAKSFTSGLIGIAIDEGFIKSVNDPITNYLPELAERDPRFNDITIRHLLLMSSGLDYVAFRPLIFNSDDILTTYYPDQRRISLGNTHIIDPPGVYYRYNKYHPQLLGMILERATGMTVTDFLQTRVWDKLGMEYGGSWSTDSKTSDFEKMETGVNARAIDFAKFGALFLNGGNWQGEQVISKAWVSESTQPLYPPNYDNYYSDWYKLLPGEGHYKYMWYSLVRDRNVYDFAAEGDKGQYIYVSPMKNLVIVRNGIKYGIPSDQWFHMFYDFASQY